MTEPEIYDALTQVFHTVFDDEDIVLNPGTVASDVPGWDSRAHVTLIVATEVRFGIRFRTSEFDQLATVGDFVRLIAAKLAAR